MRTQISRANLSPERRLLSGKNGTFVSPFYAVGKVGAKGKEAKNSRRRQKKSH